MLKRFFDILFSFILLVLLIPLWILILLVYFFIGIPGFIFSQSRITKNERSFLFYKFKTLEDDSTKSLSEREFLFGKFLRNSSLDELPQLWNILKGEMSFVGPRPLPVEYLPFFDDRQRTRFKVLPGLTGWAQVNGRTNIDWNRKLELDVEYVERQSFWFDLKILLKLFGCYCLRRTQILWVKSHLLNLLTAESTEK